MFASSDITPPAPLPPALPSLADIVQSVGYLRSSAFSLFKRSSLSLPTATAAAAADGKRN